MDKVKHDKIWFVPHKREKIASEMGYVIARDGKTVTAPHGHIHTWRGAGKARPVFGLFVNKAFIGDVKYHRLQAWFKYGEAMYEHRIIVRHLDGNHLNNHWDNICIGTQSDNMFDMPTEQHRKYWKLAEPYLRKHDVVAISDFYRLNGFLETLKYFSMARSSLGLVLRNCRKEGLLGPKEKPKRIRGGREIVLPSVFRQPTELG